MGVSVALPIGLNRIQDLNGRNDENRMRVSSGMLIAGNSRQLATDANYEPDFQSMQLKKEPRSITAVDNASLPSEVC